MRGRKEDTETTRQYTPQDFHALTHGNGKEEGIMRPGTGFLKLPSQLEALEGKEQTNEPPRVILTIVVIALAFITIITYFITQMPVKD